MRRKATGRINEEHVCIDSFIQYLREIDSRQEITYIEEPNDPPDFWVTVTGVTYAVEVTSIVKDYDYEVLCKKFFDDIKSEFATNNLKGTYLLDVMGYPKILKRGTSARKMLISNVATSLQLMSTAPCGIEHNIFEDKYGKITISKSSDQGTKIFRIMIPPAKFEGEIKEELSRLIAERIKTKRQQLKNILNQCANIILLFYDAYAYGEIEDIKKAFLNVKGYDWFHSIFLAPSFSNTSNKLYPDSPGRKGIFLYSKNKLWH